MPKSKLTSDEKEIVTKALHNPRPVMRKLVQGSLFKCITYFWNCYAEGEFVGNWHIKYICDQLEIIAKQVAEKRPKDNDLVINVPPGTTKTAMVSIFFPVWCWINWHWMRFICSSHSAALSLESAEYCRDIIRHEKFKELFPELIVREDKDQKSNFRIVKREYKIPGQAPHLIHGGGRISTSVGAKIIGFHAHMIICDDLIDPKGALSKVKIEDANHHIDHTLSGRKVDHKVTPIILIAQRLAPNDPPGHMLEKAKESEVKQVKHISLPGEIKNYEHTVKPKELIKYYEDGLLDPVRMPWKVLLEKESDLGQYGYAGQIGQDPKQAGAGMFNVEMFSVIHSLPRETLKIVRYWDKAGTAGAGAYTVGVKMALLVDGRFVVMDVKRGQWPSHEREDIIKSVAFADKADTPYNLHQKPIPITIGVEQEPGSGGKESAENTVKNLAGFNVGVDRPTGDKTFRADPYSVQVNRGNVMLLVGDWHKAYKDELEFFPLGTFKDQVDASSGAFAMLTGQMKKQAKVHRR